MTLHTQYSEIAAEAISLFNEKLAEMYRNQYWKRMDLARAFAVGFKVDEYGDYPKVAWLVIRATMNDKEQRDHLNRNIV